MRKYLEPLDGGTQQTRKILIYIGNIVDLWGQRIVNIDCNDFPVRFALIDERDGAQDLDLQHIAAFGHTIPDLNNVNGIIVALAASGRFNVIGILPGLWQGAIVPDVALVGKTIGHKTQFTLLDVLLNGIQGRLQANLK